MLKLQNTPMMKRYLLRLLFRVFVFLCALILYVRDKQRLWMLATQRVYGEITPIRFLWFIFMGVMLLHLFPSDSRSMALLKRERRTYEKQEDYAEIDLLRFMQVQNIRAWLVMLIWLGFNAIFGLLYLFNVMDNADLLMLTVFYFLCDYICILFFCPFQSFVMKNQCCVNCRIYDWGHFMMFTPMLFIRNFFSWSLFFTSVVVLIHWEVLVATHPERFWHGSNKTIQCAHCKDKTCQIKKMIVRQR